VRDAVRKRMGKQPHGWKILQRLTYLQHASYSLFHLSVPSPQLVVRVRHLAGTKYLRHGTVRGIA
jgi:hypothetical protein